MGSDTGGTASELDLIRKQNDLIDKLFQAVTAIELTVLCISSTHPKKDEYQAEIRKLVAYIREHVEGEEAASAIATRVKRMAGLRDEEAES